MSAVVLVASILVVLLAFVAGGLVGWMWWGRRFVSTRLGRHDALQIVQERLGVDLESMDEEIARLRQETDGSEVVR